MNDRAPIIINTKKGIISILCATFIFSTVNVLIKIITLRGIPVSSVNFFRFFLALPVVFYFLNKENAIAKLFLHKHLLKFHVLRAVLSVISFYLAVLALHKIDMGIAACLGASSLFFLTILSITILKQKANLYQLGALDTGFIGVIIVSNPKGGDLFSMGAFFAIISALLEAFITLIGKILSEKQHASVISAFFVMFGALWCFFPLTFFWVTPTILDFCYLLLIGFLSGAGFWLQIIAYSCATIPTIVPLSYFSLIFSIMYGFIFWNEVPDKGLYIGGGIIIVTGLFIIYKDFTPSK